MRFAPILILSLVVPVPARAQSPSGPDVGAKIPALSVFVGTGEKAGETVDLAKDRGGKPTVYMFIRADKWDRPLARYMKNVDSELTKGVAGADDAAMIAVWLTGDVDKSKNYVPLAQQSLKMERTTLAVHDGPIGGPTDWSINDAAYVTTVVVRDGKVVARFGLISTGTTDVADVVKAVGKPAGK